jgi:hypothetical protein
MKQKKILTVACGVVLCLSMIFGGCGNSKTSNTDEQQSTESARPGSAIFGQISNIDGDTITVALADMPQRSKDGSQKWKGAGKKTDGSTQKAVASTERPADSTEMKQNKSGNEKSGGRELPLSGKEQKIKVDSNTKITIRSGSDSKDGTISDLAKNDFITVKMDGDKVDSIMVGGGMGGGNHAKQS